MDPCPTSARAASGDWCEQGLATWPAHDRRTVETSIGTTHLTSTGEVLDELDAGPVTIAGHSLGAAVALAATPSERIDGLVLVARAGLAEVRTTPQLLAVSLPWLLRPTDSRSTAVIRLMQHDSSPVDPATGHWLTLAARTVRQVGAPGPLPSHDLDRRRGRQVRILIGEADRFFPPESPRPLASERLGVEVEVVERAGHLVPDERPAVIADVLASPWS